MSVDLHTLAHKEALASAPANQLILSTLEFSIPRADGTYSIMRMVRDVGEVITDETEDDPEVRGHFLRLEDVPPYVLAYDEPYGAGEFVQFTYCPFEVEWPEITDGPLPTCGIAISNVARRLAPFMRELIEVGKPLMLVLRDYLITDKATPTGVLKNLYVSNVKSDAHRVSGNAEFWDPVNQNFGLLYLLKDYPGLSADQ